jgi:membrane associated rhomboid family serine protease
MKQQHSFGSGIEAFWVSLVLVLLMWLSYWADSLLQVNFYEYGVLPKSASGLKGILFMPLIHSSTDINHIINNTPPTFFLLMALIYFYRAIAFKVFVFGWIFTGALTWMMASSSASYHIGMSGVIYFLAGFLFTSGVIRKYFQLQVISLAVVFLYGSMIWGIFPLKEDVSWEGHLSGLLSGILLSFFFKTQGPKRPKYQYEIEKEMGIEPPDLEAIWLEKVRLAEEQERLKNEQGITIVYHYGSKNQVPLNQQDTDQQAHMNQRLGDANP